MGIFLVNILSALVSMVMNKIFKEEIKLTDNVKKCGKTMEIYARVVGFMRPISQWNKGKREEYKDRKHFILEEKNT